MISVVMPNLHSPVVGRSLDSLRQQAVSIPFEVIVVGQDKFGQIQVCDEPGWRIRFEQTPTPVSSAKARNIGIRLAQADIIAFIDSDCIADPGWLNYLWRCFQRLEVQVIGGGVNFPEDNFWTLVDNLATFYEYLDSTQAGERQQLPSLNLAVRKPALDSVGSFDERYPKAAGEDADLTTRLRQAGYTLWFAPEAKVTHLPERRTLRSIFQHAFNFGLYSVKVDARYRQYLNPPIFLRHAWLAILLAPFMAGGVTLKMLRYPAGRRWWYTLSVIFLLKITWCLGAAKALHEAAQGRAPIQ